MAVEKWRRSWTLWAFPLAACVAAATTTALAQTYPSHPIRIIVPFSPGGVADTSARVIADRLSARLGQQAVVDNRPGAGGNLGTQQAASAAPDGYTLLLGFDGTMVINPFVYAKLPFDTLRDFVPVTKLGDATLILIAHPSVPAKDLRELIAQGKQKRASLSYGTAGVGSTPHLAGELLAQRAAIELTHVPYKGGGQAMTDVVGGQIPLVYTAIASAQQFVKAGKVKGLAVSSAKRSPSLPEVGTFIENGVDDFVVDSWVGILAPAKTPRPIIDQLQREIAAILGEADVRERFAVLGIEPVGNTPEQFAGQIRTDLARWERVVKQANIRLD
jgi:tripartite-type tricarboxylate transporter receptor subunit TctC